MKSVFTSVRISRKKIKIEKKLHSSSLDKKVIKLKFDTVTLKSFNWKILFLFNYIQMNSTDKNILNN